MQQCVLQWRGRASLKELDGQLGAQRVLHLLGVQLLEVGVDRAQAVAQQLLGAVLARLMRALHEQRAELGSWRLAHVGSDALLCQLLYALQAADLTSELQRVRQRDQLEQQLGLLGRQIRAVGIHVLQQQPGALGRALHVKRTGLAIEVGLQICDKRWSTARCEHRPVHPKLCTARAGRAQRDIGVLAGAEQLDEVGVLPRLTHGRHVVRRRHRAAGRHRRLHPGGCERLTSRLRPLEQAAARASEPWCRGC
mmetsp:Transcript_15873/g.37672  ORF Transcript_15873/g.37672 Transcript_15873/m.37672 type:complete len:252 (-) Transcript_15873:31-786(-)